MPTLSHSYVLYIRCTVHTMYIPCFPVPGFTCFLLTVHLLNTLSIVLRVLLVSVTISLKDVVVIKHEARRKKVVIIKHEARRKKKSHLFGRAASEPSSGGWWESGWLSTKAVTSRTVLHTTILSHSKSLYTIHCTHYTVHCTHYVHSLFSCSVHHHRLLVSTLSQIDFLTLHTSQSIIQVFTLSLIP